MRVACAQFSPQVGDINNNLNRADAALNKAKPEQLENLDLLVLPELAFTGFNYRSLQHIHPFLEPSGSGISSLWARTTALKYGTNVLVGYPEKVDVRDKWPTSPEYYSSAIMVNDDGETVFNYRKNYLDRVDQTWALESGEGFFDCEIPNLGKVCVALGADLDPYSADSTWNSFEFAFHALEVEAEVLIVSMSWVTRKDGRTFSRTLAEPDMETLTYWVQRLEPLVRAELEREVIVIFCNRSGQEDDALYAGTSAVVGIKEGEVSVYGLAGRGTKEFLFVDTSEMPFAKLVQTEEFEEVGEMAEVAESETSLDNGNPAKCPAHSATTTPPSDISEPTTDTGRSALAAVSAPYPTARALPAKREKPSPKLQKLQKLQIPQQVNFSQPQRAQGEARPSTTLPTPTIPTPTGPSPTPMAIRPKLIIPEQNIIAAGFNRKPSPFPHDRYFLEQHRFFGSRVQTHIFEPITPFEEVPEPPMQASTRFYWRPSDTLLKTPANMNFSFADTPAPDSPIVSQAMALGSLTPFPSEDLPPSLPVGPSTRMNGFRRHSTSLRQSETLSPYSAVATTQLDTANGPAGWSVPEARAEHRDAPPPRPSNPVSRNRDRSKEEGRSSRSATREALNVVTTELENYARKRTASASDNRATWLEKSTNSFQRTRTDSPKARHASRTQRLREDSRNEQRLEDRSQALQPLSLPASTSLPKPASFEDRPPSHAGHEEQERPTSTSRSASRPTAQSAVRDARSGSARAVPHRIIIDAVRHRSVSRSPPSGQRSVSRGRQRETSGESPPRDDRNQASVSQRHGTGDTMLITRRVSVTRIHSSSKPAGVRKATPEDDIVAVEEYVDLKCGQHSECGPSANTPPLKIPSIADGRAILGAACNLPPPPPVNPIETESRHDSPTVLGGTVKTTIISLSPGGLPSGSLTSPPPSATSVASTMSQATQTTATPTATPTSRNTTPDNTSLTSHNLRSMIAARVLEEKRDDTPVPAVCDHCGSPRIGSISDDGRRPISNFW